MWGEKVGSFMRFNRIFWLMLPLVLSSCGGGGKTSGSSGPSFSTSSETGKSPSESSSDKTSSSSSGSSDKTSSSSSDSSEKTSSSGSESSGEMSHTYSPLWSYDDEHHWHACLDEGYEDLRIDEAVHVLYTKEEIQPTFEEEGRIVKACHICDYTKTETLPVKEHNYSDEYICLDEERHYQYCIDPGYYDLKKIEPHEFTHEVVSPTFEETGYTKHTCTKCGYEYCDNETARLEHHYGNWSYDDYYHYGQCLDEGYEYLTISGPHDIVEEIIEPTFENQGYTHRYCAAGCGYDVRYNYRNALKDNVSLLADGELNKNGSGEIIVDAETVPFWYTTKDRDFLARLPKPPAWLIYHLYFFPSLSATVFGYITLPLIFTVPLNSGIIKRSPSLRMTS